jgi:lipid-binding SYLF domain-containing protein
MRRFIGLMSLAGLVLASGLSWGAEPKPANKQEERLVRAHEVFHEMMDAPDKGIPEDLLGKAHCIGVIPGVKKVAIFAVGGEHGAGVVTCRKNNGMGPWGPPSAFTMSGGSFGLQLGYSDTDYVLLFMSQDGVRKLLQDKFTVGADISGAAGPVGRTAAAATDVQMHAEILTYSRAKGLFAGVSLNGAVLKPNHDDNRVLYGKDISSKELLLDGSVKPPAIAEPLLETLNRFSPREEKKEVSEAR